MTKLLQKALEKLSALPDERQDELAQMLILVAEKEQEPYVLTPEERAAVEEGLAEIERGELATDEDVATMYARYGL